MLSFVKFKEKMCEAINDKYGGELEITPVDMLKNNGTVLSGITLRKSTGNVFPTFYLDDYYEQYKKCLDFEYVFDSLIKVYENTGDINEYDVSTFECYDNVKRKVMFKVINSKLNEEYLRGVPHKDYLDLSAVFFIPVDLRGGNDYEGAIVIKNECLKEWKITCEELFEDAFANSVKYSDFYYEDVFTMLLGLAGQKNASDEEIEELINARKKLDEPGMYVVTNKFKFYGASAIFNRELLQRIGEEIDDFYIVPSSIHELIVVPKFSRGDDYEATAENLKSMIKCVNASEVPQCDILSDNLYEYSTLYNEVFIV